MKQQTKRSKGQGDVELWMLLISALNVILGFALIGTLFTPLWWMGLVGLANIGYGIFLLIRAFIKYQWPIVVFYWEVVEGLVESEYRKRR